MRSKGYAVESILRVLRLQGLQIAARTYRAWKRPARIAERTITDAVVEGKIRDLAWAVSEATEGKQMTPEGLYRRRKWLALLRRQHGLGSTSLGAVDRAMRTLGLQGVRRAKKLRTTIPDPDGKRAGDLLNRDFTAPAPNRVISPTSGRGRASSTSRSSWTSSPSGSWAGTPARARKSTWS